MRSLLVIAAASVFLVCRVASAAVLSVGPGNPYPTLNDALAVAAAGDTIHIAAGTYDDVEAIINTPNLTIQGVGGLAVFDDAGYTIGNGKAILVLNATATISDIAFMGASAAITRRGFLAPRARGSPSLSTTRRSPTMGHATGFPMGCTTRGVPA